MDVTASTVTIIIYGQLGYYRSSRTYDTCRPMRGYASVALRDTHNYVVQNFVSETLRHIDWSFGNLPGFRHGA